MRGKGEGSVFKDSTSGLWTAIIELPPRNGKRRRKTIRRKTKKALLDALSDLKSDLKKRGDLPTAGQSVELWFTYWLNQISANEVRPKTLDGYRASVHNHIIPVIGKTKLDKITPAHIRRVHSSIIDDKGLSSTTALLAHRVMSVAFNAALRDGKIGRNPATLTNAPRKAVAPQSAFDVEDALRVLEHVAHDQVLGARWATGLLTAARRGEVLGIERDRITCTTDPDSGEEHWEVDLSWQLQRLSITDTPGRPNVPADFEYRHLTGGLYLTRPKTTAGWRVIPLVEPLKSILLNHIANSPTNDFGLVFVVDGRPIDPDRDSANWKRILAEIDVDQTVVLHGLRHTAIDLLYFAGVPEDIIEEIVGQSSRTVLRRYKSRGRIHSQRMRDALKTFAELFTRPDGARSDTPGADAP